ncbi:Tm-1-like ATP-binding domain-containing protein [Hydrogenoanaerobacterium sp.]|uniref:Tm-1-like ATP-binding domain-containing protein n=1 Tax=Hydrogenoanaerobacterium sp. TaxID=2953763 RepID=UPI002896E714|nr:Tm-1-like ATP-binding domain-containing protein [Hydrogenoanaerobacterium sp.]
MKTIAVIASCDTKYKEVAYIRECLKKAEVKALVVDMAIGFGRSYEADISREEVVQSVGFKWDEVKDRTKGELMILITDAVKATVLGLYKEQKIDGVLSVGGVQNTTVATSAMKLLPIGFPKVMATTIACGQKPFGPVVGDKDIVVIPSISDFTGLNSITRTVIANACACACGLVQYAGRPLQKGDKPVVGITLMGVTNTGVCAAVEELERIGIEAIGFHSTGVGGAIMEQLAQGGILDGILDLTTHEITSEYFGGGFSYGTAQRLIKPIEQGVPMVVSTGGLDFIDFAKSEFPPRMEERVYNMHNATLAHIKILPDEAAEIGKLFAQRLNRASEGVKLIIPTNGMRKNTKPGENLYYKEVDDVLIKTITENVNENVHVEIIEGNLNEEDWGVRAAHAMVDELKRRGRLDQSYVY